MLFRDLFFLYGSSDVKQENMKYVEKETDYFFILDLFSTWTYIPHLEQRLCP